MRVPGVDALREALGALSLDTRGRKDTLRKRLRNAKSLQSSRLEVDPATPKSGSPSHQDFDSYLVIDFEATCQRWEPHHGEFFGFPNEVRLMLLGISITSPMLRLCNRLSSFPLYCYNGEKTFFTTPRTQTVMIRTVTLPLSKPRLRHRLSVLQTRVKSSLIRTNMITNTHSKLWMSIDSLLNRHGDHSSRPSALSSLV